MVEDDDPYESLPPETPAIHHMMAGSLAGIAEHCIMYPVDVVKTRMMCIKGNPETQYKSITDALRTIVRKEGWSRPVRGVSAVFVGAGPAHAMYFAGYEKLKRDVTLRLKKEGKPGESPMANAIAGGFATLLHDAVMNPAEVVKQRMQMFQSPYLNCRDCVKQVFRSEGLTAFYRSYVTALTMNVPFQVTHFVMYEKMQEITNRDRRYNPLTHVFSGAVAGGAAAAITTPMDVCRTLLNTQQGHCTVPHCGESPLPQGPGYSLNNTRTATVTGIFQAIRLVYVTNGLPGFFKGCWPRIIYQMPATAISWACYESFKHFLLQDRRKDGGGDGDFAKTTTTTTLALSNSVESGIINISSDRTPPPPPPPSPPFVPPSAVAPSMPSIPNSSSLLSETRAVTTKSSLPISGATGGLHHVCAASSYSPPHLVDENESYGEKPLKAHSVAFSTSARDYVVIINTRENKRPTQAEKY